MNTLALQSGNSDMYVDYGDGTESLDQPYIDRFNSFANCPPALEQAWFEGPEFHLNPISVERVKMTAAREFRTRMTAVRAGYRAVMASLATMG